MNVAAVSGYLNGDAEERFTPRGEPQLHFMVVVAISGGGHVPWNCQIHDAALIKKEAPYLTSGRVVFINYTLCGHLVEERGRGKYWARYLRVEGVEIPNRSGPKKGEPEPGASTPVEAAGS